MKYHSANESRESGMTYQRENAIKRKGQPVFLFDYDTLEYIDCYDSYSLAEEDLGMFTCTINKCMKRKLIPGIYCNEEEDLRFVFKHDNEPFKEVDHMVILKEDCTNAEALFALKRGFVITRKGWDNECAISITHIASKHTHIDLKVRRFNGHTYQRRHYLKEQKHGWIVGVLK